MKDGTQRPSTSAETPQQPELTSDDSLRFSREASKYGQEVHGDQCPGSVYHAFRDGAKYATLHERAAAQARNGWKCIEYDGFSKEPALYAMKYGNGFLHPTWLDPVRDRIPTNMTHWITLPKMTQR